MSYRREVLLRVPFDEDLRKYALGEDMEHSWRVAKEGRLLLLPDARVAHAALGWSSGAAEQRFERKVRAYAYHYLKNLRTERRHRLAFAWLMTGIAGEALFHSAVTGTLGPWRGFRRGMRASRTSLRGDLVAQDPLGRA